MNKLGPWSAEEVACLRKHYNAQGAAWCAATLNRSLRSVHNKAYKLGVTEKIVKEKLTVKAPLGPAKVGTLRPCPDCGRMIADYRCPECWAKRRATYRDSCDGPTADEMYGVMA